MRILHFSDFHLYGGDQQKRSQRIANKLVQSFSHIQQEGEVDLVVFSGDLINQGGKYFASLREAFNMFKEMVILPTMQALGDLPLDRFIMVPGNHDFKNPEKSVQNALKELTANANDVDDLLCEQHFQQIPWMKDYKDFEKDYYEASGNTSYNFSPFESTLIIDINGVKAGIAMLNSAWRNFYGTYHQVVLGQHQVTDAADELEGCDVKIAVAHHSYDMLEEFERTNVRDALIKNFNIFFSGHKHSDKPSILENDLGRLLCAITPGVIPNNDKEEAGTYKNGFFLYDYNVNNPQETVIAKYTQNAIDGDFSLDINYGDQGRFYPQSERLKAFMPITSWKRSYTPECDYLCNDKIKKLQQQLRSHSLTIQLLGLSGFGKTRMIYETFAKSDSQTNIFYTTYSENKKNAIETEFSQFLMDFKTKECLVIVDNCPVNFLSELDFMRGGNGNIRILSVDNNVYDARHVGNSLQLVIDKDILRKEVDEYIEKNVPEDQYGFSLCSEIKKISDGFPKMAIDLVKVYKQNQAIEIGKVENLFDKLLIFPSAENDGNDMRKCIETMALFQPMPYGQHNHAYKFIRENHILFTSDKDNIARHKIFNKTIRRFDGSLIETAGENLVVRPFPLAVWLAGKWFEEVDEELVEELLEELNELKTSDQQAYNLIKEGLSKRLEYMSASEYASEIIGRLLIGVKGFFHNEKVVSSDLGSRLFLAMSFVNPAAVGTCLWDVLGGKSPVWAKEWINYEIRRNLVFCLEKVVFTQDGFDAGSKALILLASGENENYGNNATGILLQLFHILLSGTTVNLEKRFELIKYARQTVEETLLVKIFNNAFSSGSFTRSGGAQKFGTKELKDYSPTNGEILEYWTSCKDFVIACTEDNSLSIAGVKSIIETQSQQWLFNGLFGTFGIPVIRCIIEKCHGEWGNLYFTLKRNENSVGIKLLKENETDEYHRIMQEIRPKHFITKLKETLNEIRGNRALGIIEVNQRITNMYANLADEFVSKRMYENEDEIRLIDEDNDYSNYNFPREIITRLDDNQLQSFLEVFLKIYKKKGDDNIGSFYNGVVYESRDRDVKAFMTRQLLARNLKKLYVCTMTTMENDQLDSFRQLHDDVTSGRLDDSMITAYYLNIRNLTEERFAKLVELSERFFPEHENDLFHVVVNYFYIRDQKSERVAELLKSILLKYNIREDNGSLNYEYLNLCSKILEGGTAETFAVALNNKLIEALNKGLVHGSFDILYNELLTKYRKIIWPDFSSALADDSHFIFYYNIRDAIGSGNGFGEGILFQTGKEDLKVLCEMYPETAPSRLASMCPVFPADDNNHFHWFFLWLLDEYGNQEEVLDSLSANARSFSWSGSAVPLYEHLILCFKGLAAHKRVMVRDWAKRNVDSLEAEVQSENNREAYMRLHYE